MKRWTNPKPFGGSVTVTAYAMLCIPTNQCSKSGSISVYGGLKTKMASACCTTDNCTPTLPSLPSSSSSYNGVVCQSCTSSTSTSCSTSNTVQCTGDENKCLLYTLNSAGSAVSNAFRGCASQSICDIGSLFSTSNVDIKYTCTSGGGALRHTFYLPALIGLLLLKFLF
ncbi:phospholipase A2 inhibitor and Ly6/PLAUR domain-containing protein-like [Hyperolius riggenbachi]|uniref:phospholipase A2 inhibitor and Ly6/PLAUR domain-containing protein-like n=1 Tax=Hyperolius riggenbachi TaxID=752182 RepID=UPI0035A393AA